MYVESGTEYKSGSGVSKCIHIKLEHGTTKLRHSTNWTDKAWWFSLRLLFYRVSYCSNTEREFYRNTHGFQRRFCGIYL